MQRRKKQLNLLGSSNHRPLSLQVRLLFLLVWWSLCSSALRVENTNDKSKQDGDDVSKIPRATVTVPMHVDTGSHHVHLYVGSPPQRQTLIVDTGSRLTSFPCQPCEKCGVHQNPYYDHKISTTYKYNNCNECVFSNGDCKLSEDRCHKDQRYFEGSGWKAIEVEDLVWMGTENWAESIEDFMPLVAVPFTFGCQYHVSGYFEKQYADGIIGLGQHRHTMVDVLYHAQEIDRLAFAMCVTQKAGYLSLGGTIKEYHREKMKFSPIAGDHGLYALHVERVDVGTHCITCSGERVLESFATGKGTLLDSGTTDTYLPEGAANAVNEVWRKIMGFPLDQEKRMYTYVAFTKIPEIHFTFRGNVTLTMNPARFMEGVPTDDRAVVVPWKGKKPLVGRVYLDEPKGAVLGSNAADHYDVLYDIQGKRIGIAKADCHANLAMDLKD